MGVHGLHNVGLVICPNKDALLSSSGNIHLHSDTFILAKSHIVRDETDKNLAMRYKGFSHQNLLCFKSLTLQNSAFQPSKGRSFYRVIQKEWQK